MFLSATLIIPYFSPDLVRASKLGSYVWKFTNNQSQKKISALQSASSHAAWNCKTIREQDQKKLRNSPLTLKSISLKSQWSGLKTFAATRFPGGYFQFAVLE